MSFQFAKLQRLRPTPSVLDARQLLRHHGHGDALVGVFAFALIERKGRAKAFWNEEITEFVLFLCTVFESEARGQSVCTGFTMRF